MTAKKTWVYPALMLLSGGGANVSHSIDPDCGVINWENLLRRRDGEVELRGYMRMILRIVIPIPSVASSGFEMGPRCVPLVTPKYESRTHVNSSVMSGVENAGGSEYGDIFSRQITNRYGDAIRTAVDLDPAAEQLHTSGIELIRYLETSSPAVRESPWPAVRSSDNPFVSRAHPTLNWAEDDFATSDDGGSTWH